MADNIKIVGSILNTTQVSRYTADDLRLITSQKIKKSFGEFNDVIEYHVYDIGDTPLEVNYNYRGYKLPTDSALNPGITQSLNTNNNTVDGSQVGSTSNLNTTSSTYPIIEIDPVMDLQNLGYTSGEFKVQYNIFRNKISKFPNADLFVKEISPDRTEIRVGSVNLTNIQIESGSLVLINNYNSSSLFDPYLLNFGNNIQEIVTNIVLNKVDTGYEILFKLYNELDQSINEKSSLWVVEEISTPYIFDINLDAILSAAPVKTLKGPNFNNIASNNISRLGLNTTTTGYQGLEGLKQEGQGGLGRKGQEELLGLNSSQSISINIDYSGANGGSGGFANFVTFGSALSRVQNFYTKVKEIESYNILIGNYTPLSSSVSSLQSEINLYTSSINNIITNFDGFENYLYFESGSVTSSLQYGITPYPKVSNTKPYILAPTTASITSRWYNSSTSHAEDYDLTNLNYFKYSVPSYIVDDPANENYVTFLNMIGQYFDNIWIYIKTITDRNLANNNLNVGISKDVVYTLLQSLGINVFNSFGNQNIVNYFLGANTGSATYNGYLTDFSATSSYLNNIPKKDILAESYKRIYHNLPILLQRKGTVAGLNTLLSTFGIQNQDYYTISGSTYYTATGSAITSSILNVKEFGGSNTAELLKGYNNDKVRVVNNLTTGSVLSSLISIQQYTSESADFRTIDDHHVDISFSPQTQIDTYISKSISSNNPNWSLDNYIGDPRQLYSGSYNDLIIQNKVYFGGTGSYPGFTSSLLDYNGFIRLVQFFDNSMFKMLENYVPGRTNLSTGVTINSPVLERNKISYANPSNTINILVKGSEISGSKITASYDSYYSKLAGNRVAYYNGAISGSEVNIYNDYFIPSQFNPYLGFIDLYNWFNTSSYQQIGSNQFIHSDFNILQNNVSANKMSISRRTLEISGSTGYIGKGSSNILITSSLQDSYLSLDSYNLPRYDGVKIYSVNYNTYTPSYEGYGGDVSYGKSAAIDLYGRKLGLFTQIVSSSFFPGRNTTALKYLVDESGSLTELNQNPSNTFPSEHWAEIQNTFKQGKTSTIALFDNQQYGNQKTTDGIKPIFDSGYSYYPTLYYTGSDTQLPFQYVGKGGSSVLMGVNNSNAYGGYINGTPSIPSASLGYSASFFGTTTGSILSAFDTLDSAFVGNNNYFNFRLGNLGRSTATSASYNIPQFNNNLAFNANFGINVQFTSSGQSVTYQFDIIASGSSYNTVLGTQTQTFTSTVGNLSNTLVFNVNTAYNTFNIGDKIYFRLIEYGLTAATGSFTAALLPTGPGTSYSGLKNSISLAGNNPYAYISASAQFITGSNGLNTIALNTSLSGFTDYLYVPTTGSLYNSYGNVSYTFSPKVGDVVLIYYSTTQYQEFNIIGVSTATSNVYLTLSPNLVSNLAIGSYNANTIQKFLFLSKVPDETNINLSFTKANGQTSYGFIIPDDLSPDVLKNIDIITRQVKQKILSAQTIV